MEFSGWKCVIAFNYTGHWAMIGGQRSAPKGSAVWLAPAAFSHNKLKPGLARRLTPLIILDGRNRA